MGAAYTIVAAAGTNGAGKTSIVQPFIESAGAAYFNPDAHARALVDRGMPPDQANSVSWTVGYQALCRAVESGESFAFETTLGGHSIAYQLMRALAFGRGVLILYVGLATVELHIQRVKARVARGGHDIPEAKIRQRFDDSRKNLLSFIGTSATIRVWDNTIQNADGTPETAEEVFCVEGRKLVLPAGAQPRHPRGWARPLLAQAFKVGLVV